MAEVAVVLLFSLGVILSIGILAIFCLCMYLKELPRIKHNVKADLSRNIYEAQMEVDKSEIDKKKRA